MLFYQKVYLMLSVEFLLNKKVNFDQPKARRREAAGLVKVNSWGLASEMVTDQPPKCSH